MSTPSADQIRIWRTEFPVSENYTYLNHAAVAPISRSVRDAMANFADDVMENGLAHISRWKGKLSQARTEAAKLLGTDSRHIAFAKNTSEGLSWVATGYPWQDGDEIVTARMEFPSNRFPWLNLAERGVRTVLVDDDRGRIPVERYVDAITGNTRVLTASAVQFSSGYRTDLHTLGDACRERGVLFVVDGIQAMGALPIRPEEAGADMLVADGHKWMLGPEGLAVVYLSDRALNTLRVAEVGWATARNQLDFDAQTFDFHPDAQRFEPGTPMTIGIYGLHAALKLTNSVGIEAISERIMELADYGREAVARHGWEVYGPTADGETSGIVSFQVPMDSDEVMKRAFDEKVIVASRSGRVRISPHYYNTTEEIDHALDVIAKLL